MFTILNIWSTQPNQTAKWGGRSDTKRTRLLAVVLTPCKSIKEQLIERYASLPPPHIIWTKNVEEIAVFKDFHIAGVCNVGSVINRLQWNKTLANQKFIKSDWSLQWSLANSLPQCHSVIWGVRGQLALRPDESLRPKMSCLTRSQQRARTIRQVSQRNYNVRIHSKWRRKTNGMNKHHSFGNVYFVKGSDSSKTSWRRWWKT